MNNYMQENTNESKNTILREISQMHKSIYCIIPFFMKFKASKPINAGRSQDSDYPGFDTKGAQEEFLGASNALFLQMESSYKKNSVCENSPGYTLMTCALFLYVCVISPLWFRRNILAA